MHFRSVAISGLGPVSGLGLDIETTWDAALTGRSAIAPITAFDASGFACRMASEVGEFKIRDFVPKHYRKATKVMARDIELAVVAAAGAARDAGLTTRATLEGDDADTTYPPSRVGAHIGAGLIACDVDELTAALARSRADDGSFDIHRWGEGGMEQLTPLWLLKYLPNMLACHVTIIHDAQGPSNTITCAEASAALSLGESIRVIQRNAADACFCGGCDSKLNPMAYLRQIFTGRLLDSDAAGDSGAAVRPFDRHAAGTVVGEGGGIVIVEAMDSLQTRGGRAYAEVVGFGASQSVDRASHGRKPDAEGSAVAGAIRAALRWAELEPHAIDVVVPNGAGVPEEDAAEIAGLRRVFGDHLSQMCAMLTKPAVGNLGAGAGGLDLALAAKALHEQKLPPLASIENPIDGADFVTTPPDRLDHMLVLGLGYGGQTTAVVLKRAG